MLKSKLGDYVLNSRKHFAQLPAAVSLVLERARQLHAVKEPETRYLRRFERVPVGTAEPCREGETLGPTHALVQMLGNRTGGLCLRWT